MFNRKDDGNIYPRKKSRGPLGFILIGLLVVLAVAYIIYAINLPEPQPFANITPGVSADQSTPTPDGEQPSPTPMAGVHYSMTGGEETASTVPSPSAQESANAENPTAAAVAAFEDRWQYAYQTMLEVKPLKDISYAFPVMDIAHGDMMRDLNALAALPLSSQESNQTGESDYIRPQASNPDMYDFQIHNQAGQRVYGVVDAESLSFYYTVQNANFERYFEVLQMGDVTYAQLLMRDGPYPGILYFELTVGGDLRCAYLSASQLQGQERSSNDPTSYFGEPPASWDAYIGSAIPYFSALREEIVTAVIDNPDATSAENSAESGENSGGARVAASTPRPSSASQREDAGTALDDLPEENTADLPGLGSEGSSSESLPEDLPDEDSSEGDIALP